MNIMTEMCKELSGAMTDVAVDSNRRKLVMLSHNDLDGTGCPILIGHVVRRIQNTGVISDEDKTPDFDFFNLRNVSADITGRFAPTLYEDLDRLLATATASVEHHRLVVLITDLGSITIEDLYKRYRFYNHGDIVFIVIDHHKHPYDKVNEIALTEQVAEGTNNVYHYAVDKDRDAKSTMVYFDNGPLFRCYFWLGYKGMSATGMLANMIKLGSIYPLTPNVMTWAELVSKYDTGNNGNWYLPAGVNCTAEYFRDHVAPEVRMFQKWNMFNTYTEAPGYMNKYEYLRNFMTETRELLDKDTDFVSDYGIGPELRAIVANQSRQFDEFCERIKNSMISVRGFNPINGKCQCVFGSPGAIMTDPGLDFWIPESEYAGCGVGKAAPGVSDNVRVLFNDTHTKGWPLTIFSTQFFRTKAAEMGVNLIIAVSIDYEKKNARVELRSNSNVCSYEIAKLNGGGGHQGAAGFYINFDD